MNKKKIINDPIYGFITLHHEILFDCMELPEFQRLRRIKQLGLTHLVYPGALHTRFHHTLGAMHLMQTAVESLRSKEIEISLEEEQGVLLAILLHDIGHGPFSHSLENSIFIGLNHEHISGVLMNRINQKMNGRLNLAIRIFENKYPRKFFHQLVSSQLDMDRLDYLRRDSFYAGVSEGMVGIERIIQMLNVKDDKLVLDEKGIYSVEKFLLARRFMYWQVYLHKTSIAADRLMLNILKRAKLLTMNKIDLFATPSVKFFLERNISKDSLTKEAIDHFCNLDDNDIISAIKVWRNAPDRCLALMCTMLIDRNLPKVVLSNDKISTDLVNEKLKWVSERFDLPLDQAHSLVVTGKLSKSTYSAEGDPLKINTKTGELIDLGEISEIYNLSQDSKPQTKYFITFPK